MVRHKSATGNSTSKPHARSHAKGADHRWVSRVKTVSTFPPEGTFSKEPKEIAEILASEKVSPKGIGSGIRLVQYFINRAGKGLSAARRKKLERAKKTLHEKLEAQKRRNPQTQKKEKKRAPALKKQHV